MNNPRIKIVINEGKGIADACNTGLKQARGKYLFRCDADDVFVNDRISRQIRWLERNPKVSAVCGFHGFMRENGELLVLPTWDGSERSIRDELNNGQIKIHNCDCAYVTDHLHKIGGYRNFFETGEDDDLMFRLAYRYDIWHSPLHVYNARIHDSSITRSQSFERLKWYVSKANEFRTERLQLGTDSLERGVVPIVPETFPNTKIRTANAFISQLLMYAAQKELERGNIGPAISSFVRAVSDSANWKHINGAHLKFPLRLLKKVLFE